MKCFLLSTLMLAPWLARTAELEAITRQLARPLLIRNEHNSLLQLTINSKKPFVQVKSITVALEGADNLESLQFYFTGSAGGLSSEKPFGERQHSAKTLVFKGHARLNAVANHFWLSCRARADADLSGKVDVSVKSIETLPGRIVPRDGTPQVRKRIGIGMMGCTRTASRHWPRHRKARS